MTRYRFLLTLVLVLLFVAVPASSTPFSFGLTGSQEVPPVNTAASGSCAAVLVDDDPQFLVVSCDHNLEMVAAAHVHRGRAGENGPVVFTFDDPEEVNGAFEITDDEQLAALFTQGLYVNLHTAAHPGGELRGQIRFQSAIGAGNVRFTSLSGGQEVPPVSTAARGDCVTVVDEGDLFVLCSHGVVNPTMAHLHSAGRGQNGPVVLNLGPPASPIVFEGELSVIDPTGSLAADLEAGRLYVNVHSAGHPGGEIRSQLDGCVNSEQTLCLNRGRFQVEVDWTSPSAAGSGKAVVESADSGMFWFFDPANLEFLIKVIDGCFLNDRYWIFYAATTNVGFELKVTDTTNGQVREYGNTLGQFAEPILDTSAFATCP